MTEEELIKKLKKVSLPKIELSGHKAKLRLFLLSRYQKEQKVWFWQSVLSKFAFLGASAVLLFFLFFSNILLPSLPQVNTFAQAKEIANNDPLIKGLINQGAVIGDTKINGDKAYVLVQMPEKLDFKEIESAAKGVAVIAGLPAPAIKPVIEINSLGAEVYLAEIDFEDKKVKSVSQIKKSFPPLSEEEVDLINQSLAVDKSKNSDFSEGTSIAGLEIIRPQLKIIQKGKDLEILTGSETEKEVFVVYQEKEKRWRIKIDISGSKKRK
jgi:hypothetical protein